jgi:hypothetical protein
MRYLLLIYDEEKSWARMSKADVDRVTSAYFAYTEEMKKDGAFVAGDPLKATDTATTVRVRNGKTAHTDGPFAETKEQLGGYYLIEVPDLDAALRWAAKCPSAARGSVEVRPVASMGPA